MKRCSLFLSFIVGLQTYLPEMIPMIYSNVNSYRRIILNTAAPINVHWGVDNRSVGLRVPFAEQADMRVEIDCLVLMRTLTWRWQLRCCGYLEIRQVFFSQMNHLRTAYYRDEKVSRVASQRLSSSSKTIQLPRNCLARNSSRFILRSNALSMRLSSR